MVERFMDAVKDGMMFAGVREEVQRLMIDLREKQKNARFSYIKEQIPLDSTGCRSGFHPSGERPLPHACY